MEENKNIEAEVVETLNEQPIVAEAAAAEELAEETAAVETKTEEVAEALVAENAELMDAVEADNESEIVKAPKKAAKKEVKVEAPKVKNEDFDWASFEDDLGVYGGDKQAVTEAYDKTLSNIQVLFAPRK